MSPTWWRRLWHLLNRRRFERDLKREMREHRDEMFDPDGFGDPHRLLERSRDAWGWNWLDDAVQDLRLGLRGLRRSPLFTITAVLILSFGIGLNLTVFQMANVVLLRGPAIKQPETLARFHRRNPHSRTDSESMPYAAAQAIARDNVALSAVLVEATAPMVWGQDARVIEASFVSPNWFSELGYGPLLGRVFAPELDGAAGAPPAVIVSHRFWTRALAADPAVVGTVVRVNDRPATLVGVMPAKFPELDLDESAVWLPIPQRSYYFPDSTFQDDWTTNNTAMYGRLKEGVSPARARDMLRPAMASLHAAQPSHFEAGEWLEPVMATENFTGPAERLGMIGVASTVGFLSSLVLMVAAANLGNLVLSRVTARARELGVRAALGARRSRIVRQLAIETLPLGLMGAAGGLLFAAWSANGMAALGGLPAYLDFTPDWRALGVSLALGVLALSIVGALPAWKVAQQELTAAIKDGGQQMSMRLDRARVRGFMLAAQVGGSCLILIVSGMMARSLQKLLTSDLGFTYETSAVLQTALSRHGIGGEEARSYWLRVKDRVTANPETVDAAIVLTAPFSGRPATAGYPDAPQLSVLSNHVEPAFFSMLDIPLVAGRTFEAADDPATTVIISRTLAQAMYGSTNVVGSGFPKSEPRATIVGVAANASTIRIGSPGVAELYRPLAPDDYGQALLIARARTDAARLLPVLQEAAKVDPRVFAGARLLKDDFERRVSGTRIASGIAATVGVLTMLLACIGIFGVVSFGVSLRTKEIGIHLALGAGKRAVLRLLTRQVLLPVAMGMAAGTAIAAPIAFALARSPLRLAVADPLSYAGALVLFAVAAGAAAVTPALRALTADPISALRHE